MHLTPPGKQQSAKSAKALCTKRASTAMVAPTRKGCVRCAASRSLTPKTTSRAISEACIATVYVLHGHYSATLLAPGYQAMQGRQRRLADISHSTFKVVATGGWAEMRPRCSSGTSRCFTATHHHPLAFQAAAPVAAAPAAQAGPRQQQLRTLPAPPQFCRILRPAVCGLQELLDSCRVLQLPLGRSAGACVCVCVFCRRPGGWQVHACSSSCCSSKHSICHSSVTCAWALCSCAPGCCNQQASWQSSKVNWCCSTDRAFAGCAASCTGWCGPPAFAYWQVVFFSLAHT